MDFSRASRSSQVVASWLIFSVGFCPGAAAITCTTMVRLSGGAGFAFGGGGCGTRASRPLGVSGVMTMKMISSTSSTSISGVTLMLAVGPPLPPIAIAITNSPSNSWGLASLVSTQLAAHRYLGCGRRARRLAGHVRRLRRVRSLLFGNQAQLVYARSANIIHNVNHDAIFGARIDLEEDALIGFFGK